jgi:hypothetical protein
VGGRALQTLGAAMIFSTALGLPIIERAAGFLLGLGRRRRGRRLSGSPFPQVDY